MAPREALTREAFETPAGRRRAWRELMLADHGVLRLFYDNTHEVAPGKLWRTYQPSPARLQKWKAKGVKTVVNLRGDRPSGYFLLEEAACRDLGIALRTFRVFSREAPSKETLKSAKDLFADIEYPAVIHCKSGADRAGLMAVLYLFLHEKKPLDEAMKQLSFRFGHVKQGKTGVIDHAFQKYLDHAKTHGLDLSSTEDFFRWVEEDYDPAATKAEFMGSWWGNLLTEKILRRE